MTPTFGPWCPVADPGERMARFRMLASLVAVYTGSEHPLVAELRAAEADQAAGDRALEIFNGLPALTRRKVLCTWGAVQWPRNRQNAGTAARLPRERPLGDGRGILEKATSG
jgi:hypothetical protein